MSEKKHCERHQRYYYRCNDCRRLNGLPPIDSDRVLYPDAYPGGPGEEEEEFEIRMEPPPVSRPPIRPSGRPPRRYGGGGFRRASPVKRVAILGLVLGSIVTLLVAFIAIPVWHAGVFLREQLYHAKAGGFDYWDLYTLDYWSSNFFFNKTGLIGAAIGVVVMAFPLPERGFMQLAAQRLERRPPSKKKALLFWLTAGFGIFYLLGQFIDVAGGFGWGMYLAERGRIASDPGVFSRTLAVLRDPTAITMSDVFAYQHLYVPLINFTAFVVALRLLSNAAGNLYEEPNYVVAGANVLLIIGVIMVASYLNLPLRSINGLDVIQFNAVIFGGVGFLVAGVVFYVVGKLSKAARELGANARKVTVVTVLVLFGLLLVPLFVSIPLAINIDTDNETWLREKWSKQIQKEIQWTKQTSGTFNFTRASIADLQDLQQTVEEDLAALSNFRAYDKYAAVKVMHPQVGKYEALGDSDIVYINNQEYWVAPKTLKMDQVPGDNVNLHTMIYGHVEGFFAMNTFTGALLDQADYPAIFGITHDYPIFFGEHESMEYYRTISEFFDAEEYLSGVLAFDPDVLLNTTWTQQIENYKYNYTGAPDGELWGLEQFWFTAINLGLFAYALEQERSSYLINRNVVARVADALYPYLWLDPDPYLVFDQASGRMYYAVSICTDIPINSFARSNVLRFLGVALVDVKTGELTFYQNPALTTDDPLYSFLEFYLEAYAWQPVPSWLKYQLRYPETLYELQLQVDYTYHVENPTTWKQGSDFFERPPAGDLYYVESNIGDGQEFVGIDIVEYLGLEARVLAGMYVVRHGNNFGQTVFYDTDTEELIGPQTARDVFSTAATNELVLIENYRFGNTLLYPFHSNLYYFIPVYSSSSGGASLALEQLRLAGLVNATNRAVGYGDTPNEAYAALNLTYAEETTEDYNVSISYSTEPTTMLPDFATGTVMVDHEYAPNYYDPVDVVVNLTVYSNQSVVRVHGVDAPSFGYVQDGGHVTNVTVANWSNLYPGEGRVVTFEMSANEAFVHQASGVILSYQIILVVDGVVTHVSPLKTLVVYAG
ncbi:MAG: hypothetical protein Kow0069_38930 [Promethearchaeota archaeon]